MRIYLISLFDPTPLDDPIYPRFIEVAKAANKEGHKVVHITTTFRHTTKKQRFNSNYTHIEDEQYQVKFIKSIGYQKNMFPKRFYSHWDFGKKLVKELNNLEKPDIIFISMPPMSTVHAVTKWGIKNKVKVVVDIIDPWPDSFIKDVPNKLKPIFRIFLNPYYHNLKKSFNRATAITAISNGYLQWASKFYVKEKITSPFYLAINFEQIHEQILKSRKNCEKSNKLRLIYAGSLASSYDIPSILKAASILNEKYPDKVEFIITGKGPQESMIYEYLKRNKNITYLGFVSKEELIKQYALADIGLIQHKNSLTQTITYKFFNYMSAGMALLNSLQTEMAEMIDTYDLGLNNKENDYQTLTKNIITYIENPILLEKHKRNAIAFTKEFGDTKTVYGKLISFLEDL